MIVDKQYAAQRTQVRMSCTQANFPVINPNNAQKSICKIPLIFNTENNNRAKNNSSIHDDCM